VWVLRQLHGNQPAPDPLLRIAAYGADQLGLGVHTQSLVHAGQVIPHRGLADLHELGDVRHAASIEEMGEHHRETTSTSCERIARVAPFSAASSSSPSLFHCTGVTNFGSPVICISFVSIEFPMIQNAEIGLPVDTPTSTAW